MKRKLLMIALALVFVLSVGMVVACNGVGEEKDPPSTTGELTLTLNGEVPTAGIVGRQITLPSAKATDTVDGDLTNSVKVNVDRLKADGTSDSQIVFRADASKEQTFTPTGNDLLNYKITYFVSNSSGTTKESVHNFTASIDTEAPVLSLDKTGDFANFDEKTGITGVKATDTIRLPGAKGIEEADDYDVSDRIQTRIFLASDTELTSPVKNFTGGASASFRLIEGDYTVQLTLSDAAGNASTPISYPLKVEAPDLSKNLILDPGNVMLGFDARYNATLQQLEVGRTSYGSQADDCASAAVGVSKLWDEYVAITLNIDPFAEGGDTILDIGFVGSKNRNLCYPDGSEGSWAPYLILRISESGTFELRGTTSGSGSESLVTQAYEGSLKDGKDHTLYIKHWFNVDSETPANSYIRTQIFIDTLPTQDTASLDGLHYAEYRLNRGTSNTRGELESGLFDELVNEANGAGWLTFGAATMAKDSNGQYYDDIMRIKGVAVYSAEETEFGVDIVRPELTKGTGDMPTSAFVNEKVTIPEYTNTEGLTVNYSVYNFDRETYTIGEQITVSGREFTPAESGYYYIVVSATDAAGNKGYVTSLVRCTVHDTEDPEITVATGTLNVEVGEAFDIPVATVNDNVDGDISDQVVIGVDGPYYASSISGEQTSIPTEGEHELVYTVSDFAGNTAEARVKVVVSGNGFDANKNLLEEHKDYTAEDGLQVAPGAMYEYIDKYVYDQKVSILLNVDYAENTSNQLLQINLRGSYMDGNKDWPSGIVMRFGATADISLLKHDSQIVGSTSNTFNTSYWRGEDVLLQYQVKNIKLGTEDYVVFQVWLNGEEIQYTAQQRPGVEVKLVTESDGTWSDTTADSTGSIAVPLSVFTSNTVPRVNLSAAPMRIVAYSGFMANLKEIYVGKEYTEYPTDPQPPEGIEAPANVTAAPAVNPTEQTVTSDKNGAVACTQTIAKGPQGESKVTFKMQKQSVESAYEVCFVLTGAATGIWTNGGGVNLQYRDEYNGFYLSTTGGRTDDDLTKAVYYNTGKMEDNTDYYIAIQMTYIYTNAAKTYVKAVDVQMWFGTSQDDMQPVARSVNNAPVEGEAAYLNVSAMTTATITSNGILILPSPAKTYTVKVTGIGAELA